MRRMRTEKHQSLINSTPTYLHLTLSLCLSVSLSVCVCVCVCVLKLVEQGCRSTDVAERPRDSSHLLEMS